MSYNDDNVWPPPKLMPDYLARLTHPLPYLSMPIPVPILMPMPMPMPMTISISISIPIPLLISMANVQIMP